MTSMVLGTTALVLFFMPILGLPLSVLGMLIGLAGVGVNLAGGCINLRWAAMGVIVCGLALGINVALAFAPTGYSQSWPAPPLWQSVPDRPWVPPPAQPGFLDSALPAEAQPAASSEHNR